MRRNRVALILAGLMLVLTGCATKSAAPSLPKEQSPPSQTAPQKPEVKPEPPKPEPPKPEVKPEPPKPPKREVPKPFRGIHVSGWYAGHPELGPELFAWAKQAGVNGIILDIKAEDGKLSWKSDIPLAQEIGANEQKIGDMAGLISKLKADGFWVVGRIVVMNDQFLYRARPELRIPGFSGGAYSFLDPTKEEVYQYNMAIAREAVKLGVDEIQWDYIRYPYNKEAAAFMANTTRDSRVAAITTFLRKSVEELHGLGVKVSADIFGLTTSVDEGDDMQIGQDYRQIAEIVDYVSVMSYPSHYSPGTYGLSMPDHFPYETIKHSLGDAIKRTPNIPLEKHRPWLQAFKYPGEGYIHYGPKEIHAQIRALHELGIQDYILWDPNNRYERDAGLSLIKQ